MRAVHVRAVLAEILALEQRPDLLRGQLLAGRVGDRLHDLAELDLQPPRHRQAVVALQQVRDAALAGLTVDANDRLVGAAEVARIDRQVRHFPDVAVACAPRSPS